MKLMIYIYFNRIQSKKYYTNPIQIKYINFLNYGTRNIKPNL